jgi:hypothetical protein
MYAGELIERLIEVVDGAERNSLAMLLAERKKACPVCLGTGEIFETECPLCRGTGEVPLPLTPSER